MQKFVGIFLCLWLIACGEEKENQDKATIPSYNFSDFQQEYLHQQEANTVYVVNFWATWCKPCVEELPFFKKLGEASGVDLTLVSLDLPNMLDSHLKPFVKKHELSPYVVLLDDPNSNEWIPQVHKNWQGAIPATLIYTENERKFFAKPFKNYEELLTEVEQMK